MGQKCPKCGVAHESRRAERRHEAVRLAIIKASRDASPRGARKGQASTHGRPVWK